MRKIAIFSDVHGNLPALQTVLADVEGWQPDIVLVNGDVINRGPQPRECWEVIAAGLDAGWLMTIGNHEQFVLEWGKPQENLTPIEREMWQSSRWTYEQLTAEQLDRIGRLPLAISLTFSGKTVRATHAALHNTRDGIVPWLDDEAIARKMQPAPDVWLTSHTHRIFQRDIGGTLVINTGSVSVPLDGDTRAGYVRLVENGGAFSADLIRLEYDRAETERQFQRVNYTASNGASAPLLYAEWKYARSFIPPFFKQYGEALNAGDIDPYAAVARFLADQNADD